jgi:hypothetical protein
MMYLLNTRYYIIQWWWWPPSNGQVCSTFLVTICPASLVEIATLSDKVQFVTIYYYYTTNADGRRATWIIKPGHKWFCYVPCQVANSSRRQLSLLYIIFWTSWGRSVCVGFACTSWKGPEPVLQYLWLVRCCSYPPHLL